MRKTILTILCAVGMMQSYSQCKIDYSNYQIVLNESFDNITNISQLTNRWMFHHDDLGWGWGDVRNSDGSYQSYGEYYDQSQVSLQPGGILRLTAQRVPATPVWSTYINAYRYPVYKSGMIQLRRDLQGYPFDGGYAPNSSDYWGGFKYGMFEIRMKIPKGATFPAFWLIGPTQLNIYEGHFQARNYGVGYDNEWVVDPVRGHPGQAQWVDKVGPGDLGDDFHTYTGVWTPTQITFFYDGREICTFRTQTVSDLNPWICANSIITSMQMPGWSDVQSCNLDIDYIKVYKPISNNYNLSYKSSTEFMNYDAFQNASSPIDVSTAANSIAVNTSNSSEVFYRASNNNLYQAFKLPSGTWQFTYLGNNDGPAIPAVGDVRFLPPNNVVYVGNNNRINFYGRSTQTASGFYHWYVSSNLNCYWCVTDDYVSTQPGSLQTTANGEIFYRGTDNKMHWYHQVNGNWVHEILPSAYTGGDYVTSNIAVDPGNTVYYRGNDGRLQCFWKNNGVYQHIWLDDNWNTTAYLILDKPGSLIAAPSLNGALYIGTDNKIHLYYWDVTWKHLLLPYNYSSPSLGYPNADLALGSLAWDNGYQRLYYGGYDGRIQYFGKTGTQWWHAWVDDHWQTDEYNTFTSSNSLVITGVNPVTVSWKLPSSVFGGEGIFYTRKDNHLSYFKLTNCEILNPEDNATRNLSARPASSNNEDNPGLNKPFQKMLDNISAIDQKISPQDDMLSIFPNPVTDILNIRLKYISSDVQISIIDLNGRHLLDKTIRTNSMSLSVAGLASGLYIVELTQSGKKYHYKFSKK